MKSTQYMLFQRELTAIQERHALFFPEQQQGFITVQHTGGEWQLELLEGYNLPEVITSEIRFAFKLCFPGNAI